MRRQKEDLLLGQRGNQAEDLFLLSWQEVTGECIKAVASQTETTILLKTAIKTFRLRLPRCKESPQNLAGKQIGILRTDIQERMYAIRKIWPAEKPAALPATSAHSHKESW
jgi:hypothetical protein